MTGRIADAVMEGLNRRKAMNMQFDKDHEDAEEPTVLTEDEDAKEIIPTPEAL